MSRKRRDARTTAIGRLNAMLKPLGERICPTCGRQLTLNDENFYRKQDHRTREYSRWSTDCIDCTRFIVAEQGRKRYKKDKKYRRYKQQYRQAYFAVPANRQHHRVISLAWNRNTKRKRLADRLNQAVPA